MALRSFQYLPVSFLLLLLVLCAKPGLGNTGCIERERQALIQFKHGLVDDYGLLSSWGHEQHKRDCCRWRGVRCSNQSSHIIMLHLPAPPTEIHFEYQSLRGEISPSLLELEHLTHLDLSFNDFEGSPIPPFLASLTKIQYLNLSYANFTGPLPSQLGNLSNLLSLDLSSYSDLHSGNLEWLSHLSSLRLLKLKSLDLSKAIHWSQAINKLSSLIHLNLRECSLPPLTPPSLSPVNSSAPLAFLDLSYNGLDLTSSVYPWLFNFTTTLVHLDLYGNGGLSGSIPDAFGNMISLAYLDLGICAFEGEIPDAFGNMSSLEYLDLSTNQLHGSIPCAFGNMISLEYLDLSSNQLQGSIPDTFGNMSSLEYLDLSFNQLHGSIPDAFWNMSSLEYLHLPSNQLQGLIPGAFGNMSSLKYLDLSSNQLQGSIPGAFGNMSSLKYLDLSSNQLQGSIPDTIGNLASLEGLHLNENKLEGEIPKSLRNLCSLQELHFQSNNLSGQIPQDLLACTNNTLTMLDLSYNQLRGSVPHLTGFSSLLWLILDHNQLNGTLPTSIGQLTKLEMLDISSNSLQGAISEAHLFHLSDLSYLYLSFNSLTFNISFEWVPPFQLRSLVLTSCKLGPHFPSWLRTQNQWEYLDISNSNISGVIPDWFWNLTSKIQSFNISNNQIVGTLPNLSLRFNGPLDIDMSSNHLEGSIPQLPSYMQLLDLSHNKFSGSISLLCTVSNSDLVYLDLSNNLLSGGLPNCWQEWTSLIILNLENNQFSGKIPKSFGSLLSIQTLHLGNNSLIGELPSSLKKCKSLSFIDLAKNRFSGEIPSWIGGSLPSLIVLNLRSNKFSGGICSELCQLKKIQILDLSSNNMSGTIPSCFSNFTAMTKKGTLTIAHQFSIWHAQNLSYADRELVKWKGREFEYQNTLGLVKSIDLSNNRLIGEIPKEVTDLLELVSLNFSRNNLSGSIPTTIGQLKSLDVLDLSQNQLIGEIPTSLSEIDRLSTLDLSNNNLSGKIPRGTQLQSFNASAYEGNPALCGLPLLEKCLSDRAEDSSNAHSHEDNIQQDGNDMWFYVSIALGFIVGFWGVCGTLLLNNSWRGRGSRALLKWFRHGAPVHDACYHIALQLEGPEDSLLSILSMVLVPSPSAHSEDISCSVLSGAVYGRAMLHHVGAPGSKSIAPVTYMWRPLQKKDLGIGAEHHNVDSVNSTQTNECCSSFHQLWAWMHASAFNEGYDALKFACQKLMDETGILINCFSLEGQLAKLEVMGTKAFGLLQKILHPITCKILKSWQLTKCSSLEHEDQSPSCAILSLTVDDPRNLPEKKTAVFPEVASNRVLGDASENEAKENISLEGNQDLDLWDASNGFSPPVEENVLCMEKHHQRLASFCFSDSQSGILDTSSDVQHGSCPILLLKNNNQKDMIGWSIILPLSWVKAFWIPLISNGAHAIGLREKHWIACEVELPYFPSDFPDTNAYSSFMATEATASDEKAKLRPPPMRALRVPIPPPWVSVRLALDKESTSLGDTHPYEETCTRDVANGDSLTNSNNGSCDISRNNYNISFEGFVSRTSHMLSYYLNEIHGNHLLLFPKLPDKKSFSELMIDEAKLCWKLNGASQINYERKLCFLRVLLHAYKEGSFEEGAVVCAPHLSDISMWTSRSKDTEAGLQIPQSFVRSYFKEQSSGKWELQIPEDTVSREANRWPIGFVTTGFVRGSKKLKAESLCEAILLARLREEQWNEMPMKERRKEIYVLVRNLRSTTYRLALATIILEQQEEDVEFM